MKLALAPIVLAAFLTIGSAAEAQNPARDIEALNEALQILMGTPEPAVNPANVEMVLPLSATNGIWSSGGAPLPEGRVVLPVNTIIALQVTATDLLYDMSFPELNLEFSAIPGRIEGVMIEFHEMGIFEGVCEYSCGSSRARLVFDVRATHEID